MSLRALVFDFDGLILDPAWAAFSTAAAVWAEHDLELDLADVVDLGETQRLHRQP